MSSEAKNENVVETGDTIVHGTGDKNITSEGVDRSHKAAPPPDAEAGDGVKVVDGEVSELTVKDGEVVAEAEAK